MIFPFLKGITLGLGLVMPLGPLNMYIFRNASMQQRYFAVLPVLLVAGACDTLLIVSAVSGVNILAGAPFLQKGIMCLGIVFLTVMAVRSWKMVGASLQEAPLPVLSTSRQLLYSATLSLFNPHAILDTFIVIGGVSAMFVGVDKYFFTLGCIASDLLWFLFLATLGFILHRWTWGKKLFPLLDRCSSLIMFYIAAQLIYDLLI